METVFYGAITLFAIILLMPTVTTQLPQWWTKVFPSEKIHLGLDLQGGMHLILGVRSGKGGGELCRTGQEQSERRSERPRVPVGKLDREKNDQIVIEILGRKREARQASSDRKYPMMRELSSTEQGGIWKVTSFSTAERRT